MLTLSMILSDL